MAWFESFRDQVVVVTGASSGIGRATAIAFAQAGARVALVARRRWMLEEVGREAGGETLVLPTDVTRAEQVEQVFTSVRGQWGRVDVVVNNAGILIPSAVEAIRAEDLDAMMRVNVFGMLFVMQQALRAMREQPDGGRIVNVASLAGRRGVTPLGGYCATKFALMGLTEALREELDETPISVSAVLPGVVETPMVENATQDDEFLDFWPQALNMPVSWVVWAIFAAVRFRLREISVPPGAATIEELAALAPGVSDALVRWIQSTSRWLGHALPSSRA